MPNEVKTTSKVRNFLNSLALKPTRTCRSLHTCALCLCEIRTGDQYRDGGFARRAHETCFKEVSREYAKTSR